MITFIQELLSMNQADWFDKVVTRLLIDLASLFVLIRFIYFPNYKRTDLFLTFFAFNVIIFMITYLLNKVEMSMGAAFGLFAVFSILRYRTEGISAKDMTYLFLSIAIGLISAISKGSWDDLAVFAIIILLLTYLLESGLLIKKEMTKTVNYESIKLITPEKHTEMLNDLRLRTGLNIHRVEIKEIDFLKDCALMTIYYYPD